MIHRTSCPACESGSTSELLAVPFSDESLLRYTSQFGKPIPQRWVQNGKFSIRHCKHCELLFQGDVLTDEHAAEVYAINPMEHRIIQDTSLRSISHLAQDVILMRQHVPCERPKVLDFGMGWGRFALLAQAYQCEVDGVEMSESTRRHAAARGITLIEEDALLDSHYDFVLVDQVFEHLTNPLPLMRRLAQSLKDGGLMLVGVPGRKGLLKRLKQTSHARDPISVLDHSDLNALHPLVHVNLFSDSSLIAMAERSHLTPFHPSFLSVIGAGQLWNQSRQWNRNFLLAWKYSRGKGCRIWLQKTAR